MKVSVSKVVPLRECSSGKLPLYNIIQVAEILTF